MLWKWYKSPAVLNLAFSPGYNQKELIGISLCAWKANWHCWAKCFLNHQEVNLFLIEVDFPTIKKWSTASYLLWAQILNLPFIAQSHTMYVWIQQCWLWHTVHDGSPNNDAFFVIKNGQINFCNMHTLYINLHSCKMCFREANKLDTKMIIIILVCILCQIL